MSTPVPPHPIPAGPLAVRWHAYDLPPQRAGAVSIARIELENAGTATWRSWRGGGVHASYHWLDPRGNPLIWGGSWTPFGDAVVPHARHELELPVRAPMPPGRYRLAFDLVHEGRFWFSEVGNTCLELNVDVLPRLNRRVLGVVVGDGLASDRLLTSEALATQEEPVVDGDDEAGAVAYLVPGCRPRPDWSARLLDAHEEGFAIVAGSIELEGSWRERRRAERILAPWIRAFGRSPSWALPLICPSLVVEYVAAPPWTDPVAGLPAFTSMELDEPCLCDGRIRVVISTTALQRAGRPPA